MWVDSETLNFQERMLWFSVLRRAVFDYVLYKGSGKNKLRWQRSCQYLFDDNAQPEEGPKFRDVCLLFGWEPDYIRKLARDLKREDLKKIETVKFREDFQEGYQSRPPVPKERKSAPPPAVQKTPKNDFLFLMRWESVGSSVPLLMPATMPERQQERLELHPVPLETRRISIIRPKAWEAARP